MIRTGISVIMVSRFHRPLRMLSTAVERSEPVALNWPRASFVGCAGLLLARFGPPAVPCTGLLLPVAQWGPAAGVRLFFLPGARLNFSGRPEFWQLVAACRVLMKCRVRSTGPWLPRCVGPGCLRSPVLSRGPSLPDANLVLLSGF